MTVDTVMAITRAGMVALAQLIAPSPAPTQGAGGGGGGIKLPNPAPQAPAELFAFANRMLGVAKYVSLIIAVFALVMAGSKMMFGRGQRHHLAAEGASSIPWTAAGIGLAMSAVTIVSFIADR
jgi:hypothetical protein